MQTSSRKPSPGDCIVGTFKGHQGNEARPSTTQQEKKAVCATFTRSLVRRATNFNHHVILKNSQKARPSDSSCNMLLSKGFTHLLTIMDHFSGWSKANALKSTNSVLVARGFLFQCVSRFDVPDEIISNLGAQFVSKLWADVAQNLGITLYQTTAYHPQSNGLVTQFHSQLKASLIVQMGSELGRLPVMGYSRKSGNHKDDLAASRVKMVHCVPLAPLGQFHILSRVPMPDEPFLRDLKEETSNLKLTPTYSHNLAVSVHIPKDLSTCFFGLVQLDQHWVLIIPKYNNLHWVWECHLKFFKVEVRHKDDRMSIDELKPAIIPQDTTPN